MGGCRSTKLCNQGTVVVTVTFDATTSTADAIDVEVTVDRGVTKSSHLVHKPGTLSGSIEVYFPGADGYQEGKRLDVSLVARNGTVLLGTANGSIAMLPMSCGTLAITLNAGADGGTVDRNGGGSGGVGGGAGTSGSGGDGDDGGADAAGGSGAPDAQADSSSDGTSCTNACTAGLTQCISGGVQTCREFENGCTQWVNTATCGTNQTCQSGNAGPSCICKSSTCTQAGTFCQDGQTLAICMVDANGCSYVASTSGCATCCSGKAPSAACLTTCSDSCSQGQTSCVPGGLATCMLRSNGFRAYGTPVSCPVHQSCTGAAGSAACTCNTDPVCGAPGKACANSTTVATCSQDTQGCFYQSGSSTCTNQTCLGGQCQNIVCKFDDPMSTFDVCVFAP